jgi:Tfp pilus assembly protein FimT
VLNRRELEKVAGGGGRPPFLLLPVTPMRADKRSAFSVLEAIIVLTFVAVIAAIAVPRINFAAISRQRAECAARKIVTDLRRARRLAISDAASNSQGFRLEFKGDPFDRYEIRNESTEEIVDTVAVDSNVTITCPSYNKLKFGPLGNLTDESATEVAVSANGKTFTITVVPATGATKCVEN